MKTCLKCGLNKDENEFYKQTHTLTTKSYCKNCDKAIMRDKGKTNKEKAVSLFGGKCSGCGYNKCARALEFHHADPTIKVRDAHGFRHYRWEVYWEEVKKCTLLCANCHREEEERIYNTGLAEQPDAALLESAALVA